MKTLIDARPAHPGFSKSIQGNLILLLLLMLIPTILIQAYIYHDQSQTRRAEELQANLEVARAVARNFESFVQDIVHGELIIGLALTASQPIPDQDRDRILDKFQADHPAIRSVFWINPGGLIVASSLRMDIGLDISDRAYYREIMAGRDWAVSGLVLGKATGKPGFTISRGIRNEQGELLGVVSASLLSSGLDSVLRIDRSEDAGVSLVDNKGMHVHRYPATEYTWEQRNWLKMYPVMEHALNGEEVAATVISWVTGKKRLVGFAPVSSIGWVAAASRTEKDATAAITSALVRQAILFVILTLSAFCGALILSRFISTPIKQLRDQALQFGRGEKDIPAVNAGPSELKDLANVLHEMAEKVRSREAALRESEARLDLAVRSAQMGVWCWDIIENRRHFDEQVCHLLGIDQTTFTGSEEEFFRVVHPEDLGELKAALARAVEQDVLYEREYRAIWPDGNVHYIAARGKVVRDDNGRPLRINGIIWDISERKRAEAERIKLERQLEQARKAESLGRMAGAIAHHFNNKLMVVTGNLELALIRAGPDRNLSTHLLEAQRATAQAAEVSGLMLAYLGQALPKAETFDLARVCREVTETQRSFIPKRVTLKMDIPLRGPMIKANPAQARQILSNLIVNAQEALGEGEGDIQASLRVVNAAETSSLNIFPADWKPERDTYACIEVSDTGCGINPEQLDFIFDPFFSTKFAGRGLGLAVVLGTVRSYGGAIAVESEPGRGSIFRVFWPIAEQGAQPVQQTEAEASRPILGSGLVLFVDDEAQLRNMAELMLGHLGFSMIQAGHGLEALEIFRARKDEISLVILDLTMPGMNGWETLQALRALRPDIPVVLSSGYDEAKVMEGKHAELPQAFLHKPYRMAELKAALGAAVVMPSTESMKLD